MAKPRIWVAVVGAGPAGLYAAEELQRRGAVVDVFERRFAPHGVVRALVAPDQQDVKRRCSLPDHVFDPGDARFFGNVEIGRDLTLEDLRSRYDAVLLATGSPSPRRLHVPGSHRPGCLSAADFVAWYNGEPGGEQLAPNLDGERVVIVGMGQMALDAARILVRHPSELEPTDISGHALRALRKSHVREVVLVGRRGPDQATFEDRDFLDLCELRGVQVHVEGIEGLAPHLITRRGEVLRELESPHKRDRGRRVVLRFLTSVTEYLGDGPPIEGGRVKSVRLERNELVDSLDGYRAAGTSQFEELTTSLVLEALGSVPEPMAGVPFDRIWDIVPNDAGRVLASGRGQLVPGLYVAGSVKQRSIRSIEQNRSSAIETVERLFDDLRRRPTTRRGEDVMLTLDRRSVRYLTWWDWSRLDQRELQQGQASGKVREKFSSLTDALFELGEERSEVRSSPLGSGLYGTERSSGFQTEEFGAGSELDPERDWGDGAG